MRTLFNELVSRFCAFFRPRARDRDFDDEIESHLELAEAEHRRNGLSPVEARRRALVDLGGRTQLREAQRETRALPFVDGLRLDLKLAVRMLVRSWGLTLVGGATMAVVIGFGAAVFAILETVQGSSLPVEDGDRIVAIQPYDPIQRDDFQTPFGVYLRWRDNLESFREIGAVRTVHVDFVADGFSRSLRVAETSPSLFRALAIEPHLGRFLAPDDADEAEPVVVMGFDVWREWFEGDPDVIGQRVDVGPSVRRVVGVMPEGFGFPVNHQLWIPLSENVAESRVQEPVTVIARLADGVSIEEGAAEVASVGFGELAVPSAPRTRAEQDILRTRVVPYASTFNDDFRDNPWLTRIALMLGLVLVVPPAANIGVLLYARNVSRRGEFAARYALGAGRGRIVGQLFLEALVLATASGAAALVVAKALLEQFQRLVEGQLGDIIPFWMVFDLSPDTVLFVLVVVVIAAGLSSILPGLRATGALASSALEGLGARTGPRLGRTWTALVAIQAGLAMAAVPSAGPVVWMLVRPAILGPAFAVDEFLVGTPDLIGPTDRESPVTTGDRGEGRDQRWTRALDELARQVREIPGVDGVTYTSAMALPGFGADFAFDIEGEDRLSRAVPTRVEDRYFDVFGARMLTGDGFANAGSDAGVVVVNRTFADRAFGNRGALGGRIRLHPGPGEPGRWMEIVGVIEDIDSTRPRGRVFQPVSLADAETMIVRGDPQTLVESAVRIREIASSIDPDLSVTGLVPVAASFRNQRINESLVGILLGLALLVTVLFSVAGMHTLVVFSVARGRREIGLRAALGARPARLVADLFARVLRPIAIGGAIGALSALLLNAILFETATSPWTFVVSVAVMAALSALAITGPARRVLNIDPADELRNG